MERLPPQLVDELHALRVVARIEYERPDVRIREEVRDRGLGMPGAPRRVRQLPFCAPHLPRGEARALERRGENPRGGPAEDVESAADELLRREAEDLAHRVAYVADNEVGVDDHHGVRGVLDDRAVVALRCVERRGPLLHALLEMVGECAVLVGDDQLRDHAEQRDRCEDRDEHAERAEALTKQPPRGHHEYAERGRERRHGEDEASCGESPPARIAALVRVASRLHGSLAQAREATSRLLVHVRVLLRGLRGGERDEREARDPAGVEPADPREAQMDRVQVPERDVREGDADDPEREQREARRRIFATAKSHVEERRERDRVKRGVREVDSLADRGRRAVLDH